MKIRNVVLSVAAIAALGTVGVVAEGKKAGKATFVSAADLKWTDVAGVPGVKMATVQGDAAKGAHRAFHKFAAGFAAPLHFHHANHHVVVVSGNVTMGQEGQPDQKLGPGSYFEFLDAAQHTTACDAGADCILYVECAGKWDVAMVDKGGKK